MKLQNTKKKLRKHFKVGVNNFRGFNIENNQLIIKYQGNSPKNFTYTNIFEIESSRTFSFILDGDINFHYKRILTYLQNTFNSLLIIKLNLFKSIKEMSKNDYIKELPLLSLCFPSYCNDKLENYIKEINDDIFDKKYLINLFPIESLIVKNHNLYIPTIYVIGIKNKTINIMFEDNYYFLNVCNNNNFLKKIKSFNDTRYVRDFSHLYKIFQNIVKCNGSMWKIGNEELWSMYKPFEEIDDNLKIIKVKRDF